MSYIELYLQYRILVKREPLLFLEFLLSLPYRNNTVVLIGFIAL